VLELRTAARDGPTIAAAEHVFLSPPRAWHAACC
jgi:hypothetical protein